MVLFHGIARTSRSLGKLHRALQQAGFATLNLDYPSRRKPLDLLAEHIHPAVVDFAERNAAPIHFVGHSMGGLLARVYVAKYRPAQLGRVVMLGTPNGGSEVADLLKGLSLYRSFFGPAGLQLTTDLDGMLKSLPALGLCRRDRRRKPLHRSDLVHARFCRGPTTAGFRSRAPGSTAWRITSPSKPFMPDFPAIELPSTKRLHFCGRGASTLLRRDDRGWNMRTIPDSIFKQQRAKRLKSPRPALRGERSKFAQANFG